MYFLIPKSIFSSKFSSKNLNSFFVRHRMVQMSAMHVAEVGLQGGVIESQTRLEHRALDLWNADSAIDDLDFTSLFVDCFHDGVLKLKTNLVLQVRVREDIHVLNRQNLSLAPLMQKALHYPPKVKYFFKKMLKRKRNYQRKNIITSPTTFDSIFKWSNVHCVSDIFDDVKKIWLIFWSTRGRSFADGWSSGAPFLSLHSSSCRARCSWGYLTQKN